MRVGGRMIDYPPHRHIGSELMNHTLLRALADAGHQVEVVVDGAMEQQWMISPDGDEKLISAAGVRPLRRLGWRHRDPVEWVHDGIPVGVDFVERPDIVLVSPDMPGVVEELRGLPRIGICHNARRPVQLGIVRKRDHTLLVVNSEAMRADLAFMPGDKLVVRPPAPAPVQIATGDRFTMVNLAVGKGGRLFWRLAKRRPDLQFLAVLGGYGDQIIPRSVPDNVEVIDHVPHEQMADLVWARSRALLAPSLHESWNMTAAEAIAHGVPVVATPLPGVIENLGDAAAWVDGDDLTGLAAALDDLPALSVVAERARFNRARHLADLNRFVEAVGDVLDDGRNDHHATAGRAELLAG